MDLLKEEIERFSKSPSEDLYYFLDKIDRKQFQEFINGLCQAEGTFGVYFPKKESVRVVYYFIGQVYSRESLLLFFRLKAFLGGIGRIQVETTAADNFYIKYIVNNAQDIINKVIPFFFNIFMVKRGPFFHVKSKFTIFPFL